MPATNSGPSTAEQILDFACELTQRLGYNAFSYRDLAQHVGIKAASIHHHFPTKADLGTAMIRRYRERFVESLAAIERSGKSAPEKLHAYFYLGRKTIGSSCGVCLGGMLAADVLTLSPAVQTEVRGFFADAETWVMKQLEAGASAGELIMRGSVRDMATTIVAALQGAMILSRARGDAESFDRACRWLLGSVTRS